MTQTSTSSTTLNALLALFEDRFALKPDQVQPDRSFMQMGADSLSLLQISMLLKQRFGVNIPFRLLFDELSTPASVAAFIEKNRPAVPEPGPAPEGRKGGSEGNSVAPPAETVAAPQRDAERAPS